MFIAFPCTSLLAGEIQGQITDERGIGLPGVRVCLSLLNAAPGECFKTRISNKTKQATTASMELMPGNPTPCRF
jgi:hypothetical protein